MRICLFAAAMVFASTAVLAQSAPPPTDNAGSEQGRPAPRAVGSGVTMVPGASSPAPPAPLARANPPSVSPQPPQVAPPMPAIVPDPNRTAQMLDEKNERIKRAVMQSICRGC
jgi:hypothetical protein